MTEPEKARIRALFPNLRDDELEEAASNFDAYIEVAWEIFEDMKSELPGDNPGNPKVEKKTSRRAVDSIRPPFDSSQG